MTTNAFIFARGGSKGLPGKNIRPLDGKPLIAYSIEIAGQVSDIDDVFVSTEDAEIAKIARDFGAKIIQRPPELAGDRTPEWAAWQHAIAWMETHQLPFDRFVSLPATSPLRSTRDVQACLQRLDPDTDMVVTITDAARSPWFNMVEKTPEGYVKLLMENKGAFSRRQDAPQAFDLTTVAYVTRPEFIRGASGLFDGKVKAVRVPRERAIDIDTLLDFEMAEFLIKRRRSGSVKRG